MGFNFVGPGASNPTEVAQSCSWGSWGGWRSLLSFPSASTARGAAFQAGGGGGGSRQAPCPHGQEERRPLGTVGLGRVASVPGELPWIRSCQAGGIALGLSLFPFSSTLKSTVLEYLRLHGLQQEIGGMESAFPPLFPRRYSFAPLEHF